MQQKKLKLLALQKAKAALHKEAADLENEIKVDEQNAILQPLHQLPVSTLQFLAKSNSTDIQVLINMIVGQKLPFPEIQTEKPHIELTNLHGYDAKQPDDAEYHNIRRFGNELNHQVSEEAKKQKPAFIKKDAIESAGLYSSKVLLYKRVADDYEKKPGDKFITDHKYGGEYKQTNAMILNNLSVAILSFVKARLFDFDKGFKKLLTTLTGSEEFREFASKNRDYINAIIVVNILRQEEYIPYKPEDENMFATATTKAIQSKYIKYDFNPQALKFGDMFENKLNQYTQVNYKANSCFININIDYWKPAFDKANQQFTKQLTYQYFCDIIGILNQNEEIGLSIRRVIPFYEKFRLGLDVINIYNQLIYQYRPVKLNNNIRPNVLRIMQHNNHTVKSIFQLSVIHAYSIKTNIKFVRNALDNEGCMHERSKMLKRSILTVPYSIYDS